MSQLQSQQELARYIKKIRGDWEKDFEEAEMKAKIRGHTDMEGGYKSQERREFKRGRFAGFNADPFI